MDGQTSASPEEPTPPVRIERRAQNGPYLGRRKVQELDRAVDGEMLTAAGSVAEANRRIAMERAGVDRRKHPDRRVGTVTVGMLLQDRYGEVNTYQKRIVKVTQVRANRRRGIQIRGSDGRFRWTSRAALAGRYRRAE